MKDYSFIISLMEWSHSRINLYRTCPYAWFSQYIIREDNFSNFFSEYGTFIHDLLAQFYKNEITRDEMVMLYITQFKTEVASRVRAKTFDSMREKYYDAGLDYIQTFEPFKFSKILGVEKKVRFKISEYLFTGFIDLCGEHENGDIEIIDHKSAEIKPRSKKKEPTKTDEELDEKFIQLYLYSIAIFDEYGKYPKYLTFNSFRNGKIIREEFDAEKLEMAKDWAIRTIKRIEKDKSWNPNIDFYFCKNLCNSRNTCEYNND